MPIRGWEKMLSFSLNQRPPLRTDADVKTRFSSRSTRRRKRLASQTGVRWHSSTRTCILAAYEEASDQSPLHDVKDIGRRKTPTEFRLLARVCIERSWWSQTGSNRRPPACKAGALPTELWPRLRCRA